MNQNTKNFIKSIKENLHCDDDVITKIFALNRSEMRNSLKSNTLGFNAISNFSSFFNIPLNDIKNNTINWEQAKSSLLRVEDRIDRNYLFNADIKIESVRKILDYAELLTNKEVKLFLMNKFRITESLLNKHNFFVNTLLINDLMKCISELTGVSVKQH